MLWRHKKLLINIDFIELLDLLLLLGEYMRNVPREPCTNLCIKRDIWELNYYLVAPGNSTTFFSF